MRMVKLAVIGCGNMGVKIAGELALHGYHVALHDSNTSKLNIAKDTIDNDRLQLIKDGLPKHFLKKGSILYMDNLKSAVFNADFIFESVVEDLEVKRNIFKEISTNCSQTCIICSGTISLDLDSIVERIQNPERTIGVRFLFPVLCMTEVEVHPNSFSSQDAINKVHKLLMDMDKQVISRSDEPFLLTGKEADLRRLSYLDKMRSTHSFPSSPNDDMRPLLLSSASSSSPFSLNLSLSLSQSSLSSSLTPSDGLAGSLENSSPFLRECAICMDAERDTLLCPCRHLITCSSCSWSLIVNQEACPICRASIEEILHVFHS